MELWTLGELAERVEAALADSPGPVNGRVRAVPDQRAIRWYTTTGLIDRPAQMRGRTALYSRRHLLQLVAIKRRQSQGQTLAQIQTELTGAPNTTLEPIAALPEFTPEHPSEPALPGEGSGPERTRFWTDRPTELAAAAAASADAREAQPLAGRAEGRSAAVPPRADSDAAVGPGLPGPTAGLGLPGAPAGLGLPGAAPGRGVSEAAGAGAVAAVPQVAAGGGVGFVVRVGDGVRVVVDGVAGVGVDVERLIGAAEPLVAELVRQRLLPRVSGDAL